MMRSTVRLAQVAAAALVTTISPMPASSQDAQLFQRLGGSWAGAGSVRLPTGVERIRCRGSYSPAGAAQLRINLACASDSFKVQIVSNIVRQGERLGGSWSEADSGVGGNLNGTVRGDRLDAGFSGAGVNGRLSIALHGNTQAVTLVSQSVVSGSASVTLHRD